ncbi:glycerol-3-phosphate acyltransferase 2, mitochondrial [Osmerus mordax]|uniref:glycerol-3-phosphate acyltransferase 2, mitochondrial n=1 Tax=Osmerus mordax TaxID=8014 RepID=UPI0035105919
MLPDVDEVLREAPRHLPTAQQKPALSWGLKLKKKLKTVAPHLGKFRPSVGQCCQQCTPDSLGRNYGQTSTSLGFQNLLSVKETHTRYRGWLVRRLCYVLFVRGRRVEPSTATDRLDRVWKSDRVQKALSIPHTPSMLEDIQEPFTRLSPYHLLINTCIYPPLLRLIGWLVLKLLKCVFCSVQVNLNHLASLQRAAQQGCPLVYVCERQSVVDYVLLPLVLFCYNLRVPYTICPLQIHTFWIRSVLQKLGVVLLPIGANSEEDAHINSLHSPIMTSVLGELLCEGQAVSVCVSGLSGQGGQWLARLRQIMLEGAVPTVCLVPVGISYDCVPQDSTKVGVRSAVRCVWSMLQGRYRGSVRVHFSQPFSFQEMCESGRCRLDGGRPLHNLLLPAILENRKESIFGQRKLSWVLPPQYMPELSQSEREVGMTLTLHLLYSTTSCMALMCTSLMSCLLLHRHRKGVSVETLCRDLVWLIEEVLFRNKDVGFGGSLVHVVHHALTLLQPCLLLTNFPSRKNPLITPHPSLSTTLTLTFYAQKVTATFILEAVGACAVSAMLSEVAGSEMGFGTGEKGQEVGEDLEFDVVLCQEELTERALQLCLLLPPGLLPPCQSTHSFALDAVDSLVRCGILVMEEVPRDTPLCDFWTKRSPQTWSSSDNPDSDSDHEEQDSRSYKVSQPSQCPEMLFFLCSLLSGQLRALCWATEGLHLLYTPLPEPVCLTRVHSHLCETAERVRNHYECCSEEVACTTVRTLIDLGVLEEQLQGGRVFLRVSLLFQQLDNQQQLQRFISQYLFD